MRLIIPLLIATAVLSLCRAPAYAKEPTVTLHGPARMGVAKTEAEIEAALDQRISIDLAEDSIEEFINALGKKLGIAVAYDKKSLIKKYREFLGMPDEYKTDSKVSIKLDRVKARIALDVALDREWISWNHDTGRLLISGGESATSKTIERSYDIRDLIDPKDTKEGIEFLKHLFRNEADEKTEVTTTAITGKFSTSEHLRIKNVLSLLRRAQIKFPVKSDRPPDIEVLYAEEMSPEEIALRESLTKLEDWDFDKKPLSEVAAEIAKRLKTNVTFYTLALAESGIALDTPISFRAKKLSAGAFFHRALAPYGLTYIVRDNSLHITPSMVAHRGVNVAFPVYDLLPNLGDKPATKEYSDAWHEIENMLKSLIVRDYLGEFDPTGTLFRDMRDGIFYAQLEREHFELILQTLQSLRKAKKEAESKMTHRPVMRGSAKDQAIYDALSAPSPMVAPKSDALLDVAEAVSAKLGVPVLFDELACREAGIDLRELKVKLVAKTGQSLEEFLAPALEPAGLEAIVDHEAIVITTHEHGRSHLPLRLLPVEPLLNVRSKYLKSGAALHAYITNEVIGKSDKRKLDYHGHCHLIKICGKWEFLCTQLRHADQEKMDRLIREAAKGP